MFRLQDERVPAGDFFACLTPCSSAYTVWECTNPTSSSFGPAHEKAEPKQTDFAVQLVSTFPEGVVDGMSFWEQNRI